MNMWQTCRFEGCNKRLRSDNRTRLCRKHHMRGGTCFRCLAPCQRGFKRCGECRKKRRAENATAVAVCTAVGCTVRTHSKSGMCRKHYAVAGGTCTATGCSTPVVFNSKTMLCRAHLFLSRKLRRHAKETT